MKVFKLMCLNFDAKEVIVQSILCLRFIELPNEIIAKIVFKIAYAKHKIIMLELARDMAKLIYQYINNK